MADSTASNASVDSEPPAPPPILPPVSNPTSDPYSSPLYLHAADSSNLQLVPEKLQGESNYNIWSRAFLKALNAKNKMGFVFGTVLKPPADHPDAGLWSRTNDMVCTWLNNAVSPEIASLVVYLDEAHLIWSTLESRFKQQNVSKVYNIQHQLDTLHQGSLDLNTYFTKLTSLWEELRNFEPFPACTCGGCTCGGCTCGGCSCNLPDQWSSLFERTNVVKFLMRLNDSYTAVRRQILMLDPLPNLSKAYNLVSQEEQQRISFGSSSDQAAFQISAPFRSKPPFSPSAHNPRSQSAVRPKNNVQAHAKPRPVCTHCGMLGHTVARCYYLHGFPPGYRSPAPLLPTPQFSPKSPYFQPRNPNTAQRPVNVMGPGNQQPQDRLFNPDDAFDMRNQLAQAKELLAQYTSQLKNHGSSPSSSGYAASSSSPPLSPGPYSGLDNWQG